MPHPTESQLAAFAADMATLAKRLIPEIDDDFRCSDAPDDETPGMMVTVGVTVEDDGTLSWNYQTGDNSFSGGAYCHATWGIGYLHRDTDPEEFADSITADVADNLPE